MIRNALPALSLVVLLLGACSLFRGPAPPDIVPPLADTPASAPKPPGPDASAEQRAVYFEHLAADHGAEAAKATQQAKDARAAADAAELRTWRTWCRWIGVLGLAAGVAAGGLLTWLVSPRIGLPLGGIIAGTALSVSLYGAAMRWLPWALGGALVLAGMAWLLAHLSDRKGMRALWSKTQEEAMAEPWLAKLLKRAGVKLPTDGGA